MPLNRAIALNTQFGVFGPGCPGVGSHYYEQYIGKLQHLGLDIDANSQNFVYPVAAGTVIKAGVGNIWESEWQGVVLVKHTTSTGDVFTAVYGHISISTNPRTGQAWKGGDTVLASDTFGKVGSLGHLHFGVQPGEHDDTPGSSGGNCVSQTMGTVDPLIYLAQHSPAGGDGGGGNEEPPPPPPLTISGSKSPAANGNGWNNTDVTVTFTCSGGLAPVACADPKSYSAEGPFSATGNASDNANQSASTTVTGKIDKTSPTAALTFPSPNSDGWFTTAPAPQTTCTDALSGVASCALTNMPAANTSFSGDVTLTATDNAGNTKADTKTIKVDATPPTVTYTLEPAPNAAGWSKADTVIIRFQCTDPGAVASGVKNCPFGDRISSTGDNVITGIASDVAGNQTPITAHVRIDRTAPLLDIVPARVPDTPDGWYTSPVKVKGDCTDPEAPIIDCTERTLNTEGTNSYWFYATNAADWLTSRQATFKTDFNPPSITPVFSGKMGINGWWNSSVGVSFTCTDAGIGVKVCPKKQTIVKDGTTHIVATTTDKLGHSATIEFDVIIDKVKPRGTITKFAKNKATTNAPMSGTAADTLSGVTTAYLDYGGGQTKLVALSCDPAKTNCTWTATGPASPGTYAPKLTVIDKAGNLYATSAYRFTVA